jgi:hypothetical protein
VSPGCEEIGDGERRRREREALAVMREYVQTLHPEKPEHHPGVRDED